VRVSISGLVFIELNIAPDNNLSYGMVLASIGLTLLVIAYE
jgi:hypothetical protein